MKRANVGCGPHILEGFDNFDTKATNRGTVYYWDARKRLTGPYGKYDFVLINHVLCTMIPTDVDKVLENVYKILKPGGKIQVIDMDVEKAIEALHTGEDALLPASGDTIDEKFCNHVSGFGTRRSLYTDDVLEQLLVKHGYKNPVLQFYSEYDLRPNESLIIEATK